EIKRLFRPFAQANKSIALRYGGAGLGLASVKRIAAAMGGELTVASRPGGGSRFRLVVTVDPAADAGHAHSAEGAAAVPRMAAPARALSILCVEDNPYGRVVLNTIHIELGNVVDIDVIRATT